MKFTRFTIFFVLLVILVILFFVYQWLNSGKETFVNFQNNTPNTYGNNHKVYIPQYSTDSNQTVYSLYDNLYFDAKNGTLIEVYSSSCTNGDNSAVCRDITGASISKIICIPRSGWQYSEYISRPLPPDNTVPTNSTTESAIATVSPSYNQFIYTSSCTTTDIYQVIYISWYTYTWLYVINITKSTVVKLFHFSASGWLDETPVTTALIPLSGEQAVLNNSVKDNTTYTDSNYMQGNASLYQITSITNTATPPSLNYDIKNGNIVINKGNGTYNVYNRSGSGNVIPNPQASPVTQLTSTNTFTINDLSNVSVVVIAYGYDTIMTLLTSLPDKTGYKLLTSVRFNQTSMVNGSTNDVANVTPTPLPSTTPSSTPATVVPSATDTSVSILPAVKDKDSSVCGDDLSCKWFWYFNTIAQLEKGSGVKNGMPNDYLLDDYFLKTEVVPPVCPQCPQCAVSGGGSCTACGGMGGSGSGIPPMGPLPPGLSPSASMPASYTDNLGNVYNSYVDSNNILQYKKAEGSSPTPSSTPSSIVSTSKNYTYIDKDGKLVSTADPNTLGGGLALTTGSLSQVGTAALDTTGNVANNLINTTGNLVGNVANTAGNLAGNVLNTTGNLAGNVLNSTTGLLEKTGSGVVGLFDRAKVGGSTTSGNERTTAESSGASTTGGAASAGGVASSGVSPVGSTGGGSTVTTSASTFGNIPGQTTVDNYSYYGAVQSKGSKYMPVTADFSAFRK